MPVLKKGSKSHEVKLDTIPVRRVMSKSFENIPLSVVRASSSNIHRERS